MPTVGFPARAAIVALFRPWLAAGSLGQAYLFAGPEGAGKEVTALEIARLVNCQREPACADGAPCESCCKALSYQHPDIRWIGPAPASLGESEVADLLAAKRANPFHQPPFAASAEVTIGAADDPGPLTVRGLLRFLRLRPFQGRRKVAIVGDAHRFTPEAANAFLKTLEEPPPDSLIILLTANRSAMMPTLVSRCRPVRFDPYGEDELAALLTALGEPAARAADLACLADGSVRRALAWREPAAAAVRAWAAALLERLQAGAAGSAQAAAEMVHRGIVPAGRAAGGGELPAPPAAGDLAGKRERALQLCEMLALYYGELLACRERGDDWRPRRADEAGLLRRLAAARSSAGLLRDLELLEAAKDDVDKNLNLGLAMAVLFQRLIENAQQDRTAGGA